MSLGDLTLDLCIRRKREQLYITPSQDIYYGLKFYVEIPKGVHATELIGYHEQHGPFIVDPTTFASGYGIEKIETIVHPGGQRLTFSVQKQE